MGCTVTQVSNDDEGAGGAGGGDATTTVTSTGTSMVTTGTGTMSGPTTTGGGKADESTSCEDALELEQKTNSLQLPFYQYDGGAVDPAGDTDFFKLTIENDGDWWTIGSDANPDGTSSGINTVITLLDETGKDQLAQNNYAYPSSGNDSELTYHFVKKGTYCVKIEDASTAFDGQTPEGGPSYQYRLYAVPIDYAQYPQHNLDAGSNDTPATAQAMTVSEGTSGVNDFANASGLFDASDDVDMYSLARRSGTKTYWVYFAPKGEGSSLDPGMVRVRDQDENILAELDFAKEAKRIWATIPDATTGLVLEVNGQEGELGDNPFYHIQSRTTDYENPQEVDDTNNGDSTGAEVAVGQVNSTNPKLYSHYVGGTLNTADTSQDVTAWAADVDWWGFQAQQGQNIILTCTSVRGGTGLIDPEFAIYREGDLNNAIQSEKEGDSKNLYWAQSTSASKPKIVVNQTGNYYLKITGDQRKANVLTTNYACGIHVETP